MSNCQAEYRYQPIAAMRPQQRSGPNRSAACSPCYAHIDKLRSLFALFVEFLSTFGHHRWNTLIPGTGLIARFIWYSLVDPYKDLNTAKFARHPRA
jgi:hypothetical protein